MLPVSSIAGSQKKSREVFVHKRTFVSSNNNSGICGNTSSLLESDNERPSDTEERSKECVVSVSGSVHDVDDVSVGMVRPYLQQFLTSKSLDNSTGLRE